MNRYVLDTSVAIAWYLPEAFSTAARAWQEKMLDERVELVAPSLHYWEFANVLRTNTRTKALDARLAEEIWLLHLDAPMEVIEPPRQSVLSVALKYGTTVYDAVYIALAEQLDVPLLTAERSTTPWVNALKKRALSIVK